jgi:hypothetical protein
MTTELSQDNKYFVEGLKRLQQRKYYGRMELVFRDGNLIKVDKFVETMKPNELAEGM